MEIFWKIITIIGIILLMPFIVLGIVNLFCFVFKIGYTMSYLQALAAYLIMWLISTFFKK